MIKTIDQLIEKYTSEPHSLSPEDVIEQCRIVQEMIVQAHMDVQKTFREASVNDRNE
jgi:hypothetical protein